MAQVSAAAEDQNLFTAYLGRLRGLVDIRQVKLALRELLPPEVYLSVGPSLNTPLTARELESLGSVEASRLREFESGRAHAKCALAMLGICDAEILMGPHRAPIWPTGIVGSIAHLNDRSGELYAAAVARTDHIMGLGIDFELDNSLHPSVWQSVLTTRELRQVLTLPVNNRRAEVHRIWCAKEVVIKTLTIPLDPTDIEIERITSAGEFMATINSDSAGNLPDRVVGQTAFLNGLYLAAAVLKRDPK